ncbi:unnamed protein product [Lasius platythorax]|uniref:Uncharacterized protein n=1 Tax=Lasius platythorax TaxID=488582 RepID=A0AAV2NYT5_9HYME
MSTTGVSTRSSRLNSRRPSTNVSERRLRSKKVITTNKSSQKIKINTRDKSLHGSKTDVSVNNSQTLSRRLRSRRNRKNYCEDSKLLQQYLPPKQQDSVVILEKLNDEKVPIYKAKKSSERSLENKIDVYDFKYDINDTKEKVVKKKQKRKVNKQKDKMTKKTTRKKVTIQSKIISNEENKSPGLDTNPSLKPTQSNPLKSAIKLIVTESIKKDKKKIEIPRTNADIPLVKESVKDDTVKKIESSSIDTDIQIGELVEEDTEKKIETPKTNTNIETVGETSLSDRAYPEQIKKQDTKKPKIISVENADNITVFKSAPSNTEDFWPFRPKNIFDNNTSVKQKNSLNCSLLTKSLSPILKTSTLALESPWRPPTSSMFSQAKHFIQSTPKLRFENNKENMEMNKENVEMSKENMEINIENIEMNKENIETNKKNKCGREKERKKKTFHKKYNILQKKLPTNQTPEKVQTIDTNKHVQAVPARISLGEIKNLLQKKPDVNDDNKQAVDEAHVKVDKSLTTQKDNLVNFLNFSDTFDVLSETEKLSNFGAEVPLFMDLEPSHFSKPPQHSYRKKRAVKFDFLDSDEEKEVEKENVKHHTKKKKLTKSEKENEKRVNEWVKTINSTFEEIDEYNLLIE